MTHQSTVVLLHGAGTGPWIWDRVIEAINIPAVALPVPGRKPGVTPDGCAAELVGELDRRGIMNVVLVLHSVAGVLASDLARRLEDRLARCIFVASVIPTPGRAFVHALPIPNRWILRTLFTLQRNGLKPSAAMVRNELCNDLTEEDTELVISRYESEFPGLYLVPVESELRLNSPVYIKLLRDRSISPSLQSEMISRLADPRTHEVDAGHLAMLSQPGILSRIIQNEAVSA
jgi:pimeloyl-ACP methyl ester carboxylesterase